MNGSSANHTNAIHPVIREHLVRQGIADGDALRDFLFPRLDQLPPPSLFHSMERAVALIVRALDEGHDILVWGDYDVDGITATALLVRFFRHFDARVRYYIPDRLTEGYGLNGNALLAHARSMTADKLLITVDCGITDDDEIALARQAGFTVIVTDHHQVGPRSTFPADATLNPRQDTCSFPYKDLAGVGVAFYLAAAVRKEIKDKNINTARSNINLKHLLGLVAIGTIADVMPLTGINRLLVKGGFETLGSDSIPGLTALLNEIGMPSDHLNSEAIAYQVAPAINAAGRLGEPLVPLELLLTQSKKEAQSLARYLIRLNTRRKEVSRKDLESALGGISKSSIERYKCIVICSDFHEGVLGITASRLTELFGVPTLVCAKDATNPSIIKGSGRAPDSFNLFEALQSCSHLLLGFGGHEAAAGFSLSETNFSMLSEAFASSVISCFNNQHPDFKLKTQDKPLELALSEALDPILLANVMQLEPFGAGNAKPIFCDRRARFVSLNYFGGAKEHVRGLTRGTYANIPIIGFSCGKKFRDLHLNEECTLVYSHYLDCYRGRIQWKIRIENIWQ